VSVRSALSAEAVGRRVSGSPLLFLGGALSAGYLLGGGFGSKLGARLLRMGGVMAWRFVVLPRLEETIGNVLQGRENDGED
jgi:hypothetical protein